MWLLKTEPGTYGWADLERDRRTRWDGVRNPVAQKNLKAMCEGEVVVIYHTGGERAAVGLARVKRAAYPDPADASLVAVDIEIDRPLPRSFSLDEMKKLDVFADSPVVRQGRLSVAPLTEAQLQTICGGKP